MGVARWCWLKPQMSRKLRRPLPAIPLSYTAFLRVIASSTSSGGICFSMPTAIHRSSALEGHESPSGACPCSPGLDPDFRGAVAAGIAHLVGARRSRWLFGEVHVEVLVDRQAAVHGIAVHLQDVRAGLRQIRIELVIPDAVERIGHVEPLAIQAELQHLRAAV